MNEDSERLRRDLEFSNIKVMGVKQLSVILTEDEAPITGETACKPRELSFPDITDKRETIFRI